MDERSQAEGGQAGSYGRDHAAGPGSHDKGNHVGRLVPPLARVDQPAR